MSTIYLALGSNVGKKHEQIEQAIVLLSEKVSEIISAPLYESKAVGFTEQDNFVNTVIMGRTDLTPKELLHYVKKIEKDIGRISRFRWGPREIDIDILFYDDSVYTDDTLEIPHPRLQDRDFVLVPLSTLAADMIHPRLNKSIHELLTLIPTHELSILQQES